MLYWETALLFCKDYVILVGCIYSLRPGFLRVDIFPDSSS